MKEEFRSFIEEHIDKCDVILETKNYEAAENLQDIIINAFSQFIPKIDESLDYIFYPSNRQVDYIGNIRKLKDKLKILLMTGGTYSVEDKKTKTGSPINITTNNGISNSGNSTNTNTNTNTNTVNATFDIKTELDKARQTIEDDEVLGDEDKEEINAKLDEIETVMAEDPSNNEKWKKLKSVVNWVTTKGYKIGKLVMPLITKALFPDVE